MKSLATIFPALALDLTWHFVRWNGWRKGASCGFTHDVGLGYGLAQHGVETDHACRIAVGLGCARLYYGMS